VVIRLGDVRRPYCQGRPLRGQPGRHPADARGVRRQLHPDRGEEQRVDDEREDEVHRRSGEDDRRAAAHRLGREGPLRVGDRVRLLLVLLAEHLHVAAYRHRREGVLGLTSAARQQHRAEADREAEYSHTDALGDREVPELVHEDEHAEGHPEREQAERHR